MIDPRLIKEYDLVKLTDGRKATIVCVLGNPTMGFEFDADVGDGPKTWDTITIKPEQIEKVINPA